MPRQNRVTPFSALIASPARGTLTGNRGCLHDEQGQIRRASQGQRWIICLLEFKGRKRAIMQPGHYTELFFLDEATALAAGHRPCAECQRDRFNRFRECWLKGNPELAKAVRPTAAAIDAVLHHERTAIDSTTRDLDQPIGDLPDGTFVTPDGQTAYLVLDHRLWQWQPGGYLRSREDSANSPMRVVTPGSIVRALSAGYPVNIHPSARQMFER
jgi:hypothetical protein